MVPRRKSRVWEKGTRPPPASEHSRPRNSSSRGRVGRQTWGRPTRDFLMLLEGLPDAPQGGSLMDTGERQGACGQAAGASRPQETTQSHGAWPQPMWATPWSPERPASVVFQVMQKKKKSNNSNTQTKPKTPRRAGLYTGRPVWGFVCGRVCSCVVFFQLLSLRINLLLHRFTQVAKSNRDFPRVLPPWDKRCLRAARSGGLTAGAREASVGDGGGDRARVQGAP